MNFRNLEKLILLLFLGTELPKREKVLHMLNSQIMIAYS